MSRGISYNGARFRQRSGPSLGMTSTLAKQLLPEPRKPKPAPVQRGSNAKVSDEAALLILLEKLDGATYAQLEARHGVSKGVIQQWMAGTNRPHLIEQATTIITDRPPQRFIHGLHPDNKLNWSN